jgi:hypothetical protein
MGDIRMFGKTENHRDIVASIAEEYESSAGHKNMLQLIHLRWLAVFGQIATIALVVGGFGIRLPVLSMAFVLAVLIAFNIASHLRWHEETKVSNRALFFTAGRCRYSDGAAVSERWYLQSLHFFISVAGHTQRRFAGSMVNLADRGDQWSLPARIIEIFSPLTFALR